MKFDYVRLTKMAKDLFEEERKIDRLDGWFIAQEIKMNNEEKYKDEPTCIKAARNLFDILDNIPISLSDNQIFAGTQRDAFAMTYALINPSFRVESFSGYCDQTAVFNDITPNEEFTKERIDKVKDWFTKTDYVEALNKTYKEYESFTGEVAFFMEQVTGHTICDFGVALQKGTWYIMNQLRLKIDSETDEEKKNNYKAMLISLKAANNLSGRYHALVGKKIAECKDPKRISELRMLQDTLRRIPMNGCRNIYDAIQSYLILWQTMCMEQLPNPYAFSIGNCDRIFKRFYDNAPISREELASLFKHFLVFFNIGTRSWAISQNVLISGKDNEGNDLTNDLSYALLDAYYDMNLPQPILSVKIHKNTPNKLYEELGKFFFTPGCLTPSIFNDDSLFVCLRKHGIEEFDIPSYAVAGCQEPLIMGKDSGNTTNTWLNLGKILELTLNNGVSLITGEKMGPSYSEINPEVNSFEEVVNDLRSQFYKNLEYYLDKMTGAANKVSKALSLLPVPFLSVFMGGVDSGYDMRDPIHQGTKYNGSGCLIHGLSIVGDSFVAVDKFLKSGGNPKELLDALKNNFVGYEDLHKELKSYPKFGNNISVVDDEVRSIAIKVSQMVRSKLNYLGNPFRPDFSTPSTHLTYGYHVGATPDGREAREMMGYGVDPLYGEATNGLGFRMLSAYKLPYHEFNGGYASHIGVDPNYFKSNDYEGKGIEFKDKIIDTVFFSSDEEENPFYLYVNVTTAETLRAVLANPKKYAPTGVYIMRIHGTFVNFLDLSPAIQEDIIKRLDSGSTRLASCVK